ncbi:hypothetical protein B0H19DRAFT_1264604 [Mycena capillaripes]|nr:hypothetical protein B0H19DRAFT_1264604 [Mycena capillaripes]
MGKLFAKFKYRSFRTSPPPTAESISNFLVSTRRKSIKLSAYQQQGAHEFFISTLNYIHSIFRGSTNVSCNCTIRSTLTVQLQSHVCERCGNVVGPILDISVERDKTGEGVSEDNTVVLARFALSCLFKRNRFAGIRSQKSSTQSNTGTKLRKGPDLNQHGALGMGLQYASGTTAFALIAYVVPISDHHLRNPGRIRQPRHYDGRRGAVGALDAGIVKPNVAPTVLDQYTHQKLYVTTTQQGERVIVNPEMTIQRIITIYYDFRHRLDLRREDRWLLAGLRAADHHLLHRAHHLPGCAEEDVIWLALRKNKLNPWARDFWVKVSRARLAAEGFPVNYPDKLLNDGTIGPLNSNQGAAMIRNCAPNDLLNNFNALGLVVLAPIVAYIVYPGLEKLGIKIVQLYVYRTSPCGYQASAQLANVVITAVSELFVNVIRDVLCARTAEHESRSVLYFPAIPLFFQTTVFWIRYRDVDEKFTTYEDAGVEEVNVHHYAVEGKNSRSEDEKRSRWRLEDV